MRKRKTSRTRKKSKLIERKSDRKVVLFATLGIDA